MQPGFAKRWDEAARVYARSRSLALEYDDALQAAREELLKQERRPAPENMTEKAVAYATIKRGIIDASRAWTVMDRRNHAPLAAVPFCDYTYEDVPDPRDTAADFALANDAHRAVVDLPVRERALVQLRFWHGWSMVELAVLFDVSDSRISQLFDRAFAHLRESLVCSEGVASCNSPTPYDTTASVASSPSAS